jgi:hypothetical protein
MRYAASVHRFLNAAGLMKLGHRPPDAPRPVAQSIFEDPQTGAVFQSTDGSTPERDQKASAACGPLHILRRHCTACVARLARLGTHGHARHILSCSQRVRRATSPFGRFHTPPGPSRRTTMGSGCGFQSAASRLGSRAPSCSASERRTWLRSKHTIPPSPACLVEVDHAIPWCRYLLRCRCAMQSVEATATNSCQLMFNVQSGVSGMNALGPGR